MKNFYLTPFLLIIVLLSSISCIRNNFKENNKAQKEYLLNIEIVEKFIMEKGTNNTERLNNSALFLERITRIKSEKYEGFDLFYFPSEQNLKDWKDWYNKNKKRLCWNEKEQKVKLEK